MDDICVDCKEVGGVLCKRKLCAYHAALEDLKENIANEPLKQDIFYVPGNIWADIAYVESERVTSFVYGFDKIGNVLFKTISGSADATPNQGSPTEAGIKPTLIDAFAKISGPITVQEYPGSELKKYTLEGYEKWVEGTWTLNK